MPIQSIRDQTVQGPSAKGQGPKIDEEKLKKACMNFESLFIQRLWKSMRQTVMKSGLFGGGTEEEVYQSLFDQELSKSLASGRGISLGKMIYEQMMKKVKE
jgi:flagellar protein FlgJ